MLAALSERRGPVVAPIAVGPMSPALVPDLGYILPSEVARACEQYGFGDPLDVSQNYRRASEMHAAGKSAEVILRAIRQGADTSGMWV